MNARLSASLLAVAVFGVAGCSSSVSAGSVVSAVAPLSPVQVATNAGCTGIGPITNIGTIKGVSCTLSGHDVYVFTFVDDIARDNWLKTAKAAGATGSFQQGPRWIIQTP